MTVLVTLVKYAVFVVLALLAIAFTVAMFRPELGWLERALVLGLLVLTFLAVPAVSALFDRLDARVTRVR